MDRQKQKVTKDRNPPRKQAVVERPAAAIATNAHPVVAAVGPMFVARTLQQRLGNRGTQTLAAQVVARASTSGIAPNSGAGTGQFSLSHPDDAHEREADRVADVVMRGSARSLPSPNRLTATRLSPGAVIQRRCTECEDDANCHKIQRKEASTDPPQIIPSVSAGISALKGGGSPLPAVTRAFFEPRFGADFSQVRIHTDTHAARTATSINGKAFTVGKDIDFSAGQSSPDLHQGRQLVAGELTHVVQQDGEWLQRARIKATESPAIGGDQSLPGKSLVNFLSTTGTDAGQEQAAPVQGPRGESFELSESDPSAQPTSVMVGGGSSGGGARDSGGGSGDQPSVPSPERQAAAIIADSAHSEQQVKAVAAARRGEISARFAEVRGRTTGLLASLSAGIQTFVTARQAEVQTTTASILTAGQAMQAGTVKAAQGQIQQARTVLDGVAGSATVALERQVSQTAGRITGFVDGLPLPDLPGVSAIRAGARALAGGAASAVTATLGQVRGLVGAALQRGAEMLGSLLSLVSQAASSALNRIGSMIQAAVRSVFAGLSRMGAALLNGLRRAVDGTVLAGLRRVESTLIKNLATAERQAIIALRANRDEHLQALRDGRGATDGSTNLAEEARQNSVAVVTTFRERVTGLLGSIFGAIGAGAAALRQQLGQLLSRVIAVVQAPLTQILAGLRQVGQAVGGFLQSLLSDLAAGITSVVGFVRSLIQNPMDAVINFATRAVSKAVQFFAGLPSRLLGGNFSLPGVTELIGEPLAKGPIIKPPPGPIVKPILTFLSLLFLTVGAIILYFAPSLVAAVAAALAALGITVAPVTLLIIVGIVAVAALIAALVLLYLLYRLVKPGPKPPKPPKKPVKVTIGGGTELWYFDGATPPTYPLSQKLTATVTPPTAGSFTWTVTSGVAFGDFSGSPTAVGPVVVLRSKSGSAAINDVQVKVDFAGAAGETGTDSLRTTVRVPQSMTSLGNTGSSTPFPPANWRNLVSYSIQDQFGKTLPRNVPINEQWTNKPPVAVFPGTNWPSFPPTEGSATVNPARWSDNVAIRDGVPPVLIPTPNASGTGGPLIQRFAGHWRVGSLIIGAGRRALSVTWRFFHDHGDHV
jgi:hypothetical protein